MDWLRSRRACYIAAIAFVEIVVALNEAHADAVVVTRAMKASTIVEIFIDEEQVRAEIEIGAADVTVFANVLPDEIYEKVTGQPKPLDERLQTFFESDWVVKGGGRPLRGKLERIISAKRVVRDDVTGEALPDQPADAETVIHLTLRYELEDRPQSLTIHPPRNGDVAVASIGFVCYHNGLPVNDFRYMPGEVTLDLDWADPWYSRFHNPNLRRQFDAPLSGYLYIEPSEVRQEIIVRPRDLQSWLDLELRDDGVIPVEQQGELKRRVADFLSTKNPVTIDGRPAQGKVDRIHFVRRTLRMTGVIEPAEDLDATSATLGVILVYPVDRLPQHVSMKWELFSRRIRTVSAVASDEAGGMPSQVTPDDPIVTWKNYLTNPTSPRLITVAPPPLKRQFVIPLISLSCGAAIAVLFTVLGWQRSTGKVVSWFSLGTLAALVVVGVMSLPLARVSIADPFGEPPVLSEKATEDIVSGLLYNVYRSFDHHDDNVIYDRLAKSISGDLLSDVYLETRKSMEVKNQGGMRVSVKEVAVTEIESVDGDAAEPTLRCRWRVSGWIGHWGHVHSRANEHLAIITIAPSDGAWKITGLEVLDEQPVEGSRKPISPKQGAGA